MPETHKRILEQANAAIAKGDIEGFLGFCTEDTEWTFVGERTLRGKEAVRRYLAEAYKEPPEFHVDRMIAEGDLLVAMGEITLNNEAGARTRYAYCDVWRVRDEKLFELQAFVIEAARNTRLVEE